MKDFPKHRQNWSTKDKIKIYNGISSRLSKLNRNILREFLEKKKIIISRRKKSLDNLKDMNLKKLFDDSIPEKTYEHSLYLSANNVILTQYLS